MRVFVSTYNRYNSGNLSGLWLNLEDYAEAGDVEAAARDALGVPDDVELMYPDYEGFPKALYSESAISDALMDYVHSEHEAKEAYVDIHGMWDAQDCDDRYVGRFKSHIDFAWDMLDQSGDLDAMPAHLRAYFDIAAFARDLMFDYSEHAGHYFMP